MCRRASQALVLFFLLAATSFAQGERLFAIRVVDRATRRGVPLVELETVDHVRLWTDSNGIAAFDEPGLMDREVFFHVSSHGYEYPADGFGYRGVRLVTTPGGEAVVELDRINVAERLYRITGAGIYRDSVLVGAEVPIAHPLLNGDVTGQDTVMACEYRGELYWFWGDTNRVRYPLGNFFVAGATSKLPRDGGLGPERGIELTYFEDDEGFAKKMCPLESPGPVWIEGLVVLPDEQGRERLLAQYSCMKSLGEVAERGLVVFDDDEEVFEKLERFDLAAPLYPRGQPIRVERDGEEYLCFALPGSSAFPNVRVKADLASLRDPRAYEALTPLVTHGGYDEKTTELERDAAGALVYAWKRDTAPLDEERQEASVRDCQMAPEERPIQVRDVETGKRIHLQAGTVAWNEHRRRWIMIACELFGEPSVLGETWFAEADTVVGPWVYARRVITHDRYSFYNPVHHPFFDGDGGRRIHFEGTYATTFSTSAESATPRYDYNQIMYALDLDDPRLSLPCPVYRIADEAGPECLTTRSRVEAAGAWDEVDSIAFFAIPPESAHEGLVPVRLGGETSFYGLSAESEAGSVSADLVLLYAYTDESGAVCTYSTEASLEDAKWRRSDAPVCRVWLNPLARLVLAPELRAVR